MRCAAVGSRGGAGGLFGTGGYVVAARHAHALAGRLNARGKYRSAHIPAGIIHFVQPSFRLRTLSWKRLALEAPLPHFGSTEGDVRMDIREVQSAAYVQSVGPASSDDLSAHPGIGARCVRTRIAEANEATAPIARIEHGRGRGYTLRVSDPISFSNWLVTRRIAIRSGMSLRHRTSGWNTCSATFSCAQDG